MMPRKTRGTTSNAIVRAARTQRKEETAAETRLWEALRGRRCDGLKFRRQHPVENYVLDFYCLERLLAVEVDGNVHDDPVQIELDRERTLRLNEMGIRVLRIKNEEVMTNLPHVLDKIQEQSKTSSQ